MKFTVQRVILAVLAVAAVGGAIYSFQPKPVLVEIGEVLQGRMLVTVNEDGKTRIRDRYVVSAPLAGRLLRIGLRAGDPVTAGETLLAAIEPQDPSLLDARTLATAEARVSAAEAALNQAQIRLDQAEAAVRFHADSLRRVEELAQNNRVAEQKLEAAQFEYDTQSLTLRSAKFAEEIARFELQQAKAALMRSNPESEMPTTDNGGWRFHITAPVTGKVLTVFQESSAVLNAGTPLLEVGDPTDLEIEIDVLSSDAVQVARGGSVILEHWGGERPLTGKVRLVEPSAFTKISSLGVEEQRVNVIVDLVDPPEQRLSLGHGYRVEARIVIWEGERVLKVPNSALFRHQEKWSVFRVDQLAARRVAVKIGQRNELETEIVSGLQAGDQIILHPSDDIETGTRVRTP